MLRLKAKVSHVAHSVQKSAAVRVLTRGLGQTAHGAAGKGNLVALREVLPGIKERGAQEVHDMFGGTAMHAAVFGHERPGAVIQELMKAGFDLNAPGLWNRMTPLHDAAVKSRNAAATGALLDAGASLTLRDFWGRTPYASLKLELSKLDRPNLSAAQEKRAADLRAVLNEYAVRSVMFGFAKPGAKVEVTVDGQVAGQTTADRHGDWALIPREPLSAGNHSVGTRDLTSPTELAQPRLQEIAGRGISEMPYLA